MKGRQKHSSGFSPQHHLSHPHLSTYNSDHSASGLSFVFRSSDSTMWYKDAGGNFFVPVPGKVWENGRDAWMCEMV